MKIGDADHATRLHVTEHVVTFLNAATAAGNSGARVSLKEINCPSCAQRTLRASASLKSSNVAGHVMRRQFEVVAHCQAAPCTFAGTTNGKFTIG